MLVMFFRHLQLVLFLTWTVVFIAPTQAAISELVVFGDSLSDTGNASNLTGGLFPPPPYFEGRFSNGRAWVERLGERLGVSEAAPSTAGGLNYALGGSRIRDIDDAVSPADIGQQIQAALSGSLPLADRPPLTLDGDELVVLWGAGNDIIGVDSTTDMASLARTMAEHVRALAAAGGARFLVGNIGRLSSIPGLAGLPSDQRAAIDLLVRGYNDRLALELAEVASDTGATIRVLDTYALSEEIEADPAAFGFTNITEAALTYLDADGDPIRNPVPSGDIGRLGEIAGFELPSNLDEYLFFDEIHPTARYHEILASRAYVTIIPEPGGIVLAAIGGSFGLLTLRRETRRRDS